MRNAETVGRFAPTPSGRMHLGNVYAAMIAYLSAKSKDGKFLLRIEDLDTLRCPRSKAEQIISDLKFLGFEFDGDVVYQSEREKIYEKYEKELESMGLVYPCFCSRSELHAASAPHGSDGVFVYDGKCASLSKDEIEKKSETRRPCKRVRVPGLTVSFFDAVKGEYSQDLKRDCGDFIIRRSDGVFAYQLAVTVDDALCGVTEVVRGEDLISSAPRQIWLTETLGFKKADYAHIPLLTARGGRRLAKRDGDTMDFYRKNFSPERIIGALAYVCGIIDEPCDAALKELVKVFSFDKLNREVCLDDEFLCHNIKK